jgi:hypothetical protein
MSSHLLRELHEILKGMIEKYWRNQKTFEFFRVVLGTIS